MNDTPSKSLIKKILYNFEKNDSVHMCFQTQKCRPKTRNGQNSAQKHGFGFSIIKTASTISVLPTLVCHNFHDEIHLKPYKFHP